jgi:hypothetical protein
MDQANNPDIYLDVFDCIKKINVLTEQKWVLQTQLIAGYVRSKILLPICKKHKILWKKTSTRFYWHRCPDALPFTTPKSLYDLLHISFHQLPDSKLNGFKGTALYHYILDFELKEILSDTVENKDGNISINEPT